LVVELVLRRAVQQIHDESKQVEFAPHSLFYWFASQLCTVNSSVQFLSVQFVNSIQAGMTDYEDK